MLVDDAIVVVELMEIKLAEGWERKRAAAYAFETCAFPLLTGTIITCVGFTPIYFSRGSVGEFAGSLFTVIVGFTPIYFSRGSVGEFAGSLFTVISLALMLSWVVSATVAPVLQRIYNSVLPKIPQPAYMVAGAPFNGNCRNHRHFLRLALFKQIHQQRVLSSFRTPGTFN